MGAKRTATPHECARAYHTLRALVEEFGIAKVIAETGLTKSFISGVLRRDGGKEIAKASLRHIDRAEKALKRPISVRQAEAVRQQRDEGRLMHRAGESPTIEIRKPEPEPEPPAPEPDESAVADALGKMPVAKETPVIPLPVPKPPAPQPEPPRPAAEVARDPIERLRAARTNLVGAVEILRTETEALDTMIEELPKILWKPLMEAVADLRQAGNIAEEALLDIEL